VLSPSVLCPNPLNLDSSLASSSAAGSVSGRVGYVKGEGFELLGAVLPSTFILYLISSGEADKVCASRKPLGVIGA
jgi:hypothetical protein